MKIRGIKEMPSGRDEELALIFREMRKASQMPPGQLADHLSTSAEVIAALEEGSLLALPEWSETARVVTAYTGMLQLDARPILRRMHAQIASRAPAETTPPAIMPAPPPATTPPPRQAAPQHDAGQASAQPGRAAQPRPQPGAPAPQNAQRNISQAAGRTAIAGGPAREKSARPARPKRSMGRRLLSWTLLLSILAGGGLTLFYLAQNPKRFYSVVDRMPDPLPRLVRAAIELMKPLPQLAPVQSPSGPPGAKTDRLDPNRPR